MDRTSHVTCMYFYFHIILMSLKCLSGHLRKVTTSHLRSYHVWRKQARCALCKNKHPLFCPRENSWLIVVSTYVLVFNALQPNPTSCDSYSPTFQLSTSPQSKGSLFQRKEQVVVFNKRLNHTGKTPQSTFVIVTALVWSTFSAYGRFVWMNVTRRFAPPEKVVLSVYVWRVATGQLGGERFSSTAVWGLVAG